MSQQNSSAQQKTEQATPKRLKDARKKGQIARSRELTTLVMVGASVIGLLVTGGAITDRMHAWMTSRLDLRAVDWMRVSPMEAFKSAWVDAHMAVAPLFFVCLIAAAAGPVMLGGWSISSQALKPDFSRVNPIKGLGRVFSLQGLMELGKTSVKFLVLGAIAVAYLWTSRDDLLALASEPTQAGIASAMITALGVALPMCAGLALIAAVDAPFQLFNHKRELKMTRQEVRDELKETEGRPEVKSRQRELQQAVARGRMMDAVPTADVVITNPTHYAVALRYDAARDNAPVVVAKGADHVAAAIRELAETHGVARVEAPPLARVLFRSVDIGMAIPADLYRAVAQVLTYVRQLEAWHAGPPPELPELGVTD